MCVCVCVCVCGPEAEGLWILLYGISNRVGERERERLREGEREAERERLREGERSHNMCFLWQEGWGASVVLVAVGGGGGGRW